MLMKTFLAQLGQGRKTNYFVLAPDNMGLNLLVPKALSKVVAGEDLHFFDSEGLTKEKARQIEREARKAPVGMSDHTYFVVQGLQKLPVDSVGPLLKAVEEAKYSVFIFQAQSIPRHVRTLLSRSVLVKLPFLQKKVVLGNMEVMHHDARTADEAGLYDGTLAGTIRALGMKDTISSIRRDMRLGARGLPVTLSQDVIGSLAFDTAIYPFLRRNELDFLRRDPSEDRKKLVMFLASDRESQK